MSELEALRAENALLRQRNTDLEAALAARPLMGRAALFSLIDALPLLVGVIEADGRASFLGRSFSRWLAGGVAADRPLIDRLAPSLKAEIAPLLPLAFAGEPHGFYTRLADADGEARDLSLGLTPRRGENGAVTGVILVGQDVTDARRADEALGASERRLRLAAHAAGLGIWDFDPRNQTMVYSDRAKAIFGLPADAPVTPETLRAAIHPDDAPTVAEMSERARDPSVREQLPFEYRVIWPDGSIHWVLAHGEPVFGTVDGRERAIRYVGTIQDITERKAVEEALAESESRLRLLIEGGRVGSFDTDLETGEGVWSASTFEMLGMRPPKDGKAHFEAWTQRLHPDDRERVAAEHTAAVAAGGPWQGSYRIVRADTGEVRWLSIWGRIVPRPGQAPRSVGMIVDSTDERQAQARQRLLLNELNHRVKNTLAAVQAIARSTLRGHFDAETATALFNNRLLALSAAHDVLTRETWEGAGLREIVAGSVRAYQDRDGARFQIEGPDVRIGPKAAVALAMALHELATNAAKYGALTAEEGKVILRWEARGQGGARRLELEWREVGGPPVEKPARGGFGSRLLRQGLKLELGASADMRFEPDGLVCVIHAPLNADEALETA